ncbi:NAD-dependent epimerase/dehydratase family protein [Chitinophaga cymbidii]|uniref:Epimerase n=1 Tax=Chitinophaga cymbidii TaxID=1096750 RepID=A0A512RME8_9BACT|nr:NAD-dependent epimerase/dehydratase family protein [Chitinophaga cymbidii]GEP96878.1 epimerase [Chitinophaga cymbidii]
MEYIYQELLKPSPALLRDIAQLDGDILLLGVGGKMGPAMARLAKAAVDAAGIKKKITGVSRFSEPGLQEELNSLGIETIKADLLNDKELQSLPVARNVIYLAGQKFGTTGKEAYTWAMNTYLPGRVAEKYKDARIVVFSTGNVYPLSPVLNGGLTEEAPAAPVGEYGQSCLGRERMFQYFSSLHGTPLFIYRLNYANDVSYGVLLEIAKAVYEEREIDLRMGHVNVIWQGDANEIAIRALLHCESPAKTVNVTGPETVAVRWLANEFGKRMHKTPFFVNAEQPDALLSNSAECFSLFGYPKVTLKQMIDLIAGWVTGGGKTINKPTHFQEREGKF